MPSYAHVILAGGAWIWLLFAFAFGACAGSLINVLVYRLPLGLSVVSPPSRCPACGTKLTWRENIPVLGWVFLRGRCRFCKSRISPEYPLVEAMVGLLFAGLFLLWYVVPQHAVWLGVDWGMIRPEWAELDATRDQWPRQSWPMFIVLAVLVASLVAMSLVDIKTYTIPLQIPWFATVVGLLMHVGYAAWRGRPLNYLLGAPFTWSIPTPSSWWWVGASIGGVVGLGIGVLFLRLGWIRRSFADYAEWEKANFPDPSAARPAPEPEPMGPATAAPDAVVLGGESLMLAPVTPSPAGFPVFRRLAKFAAVLAAVVIVLAAAGSLLGGRVGLPEWSGLLAGVVCGPLVAAAAIRKPAADPAGAGSGEAGAGGKGEGGAPADVWIQYPHARREMIKEILFLTPCIGLGWLGGVLASRWGGDVAIPLWLSVLAGVLMGYLIGGGVVWGARIVGSLGFAKEALGLGDVHLMAAVGACLGWVDAALAFPLAAAVGLYWVIVHTIANRETPRAMQFGPYLAAATLLVVLGKPLIEMGLTHLLGIVPPNPPVNLH